jgi:hypothetical protein
MPARLFWAHATMRSRLEAEEALASISQVAAGSGTMEAPDQRAYLASLRRAMTAGREERAPRATMAALAKIGIHGETVPRKDENGKQGRR